MAEEDGYELVLVTAPDEWETYHAIRQAELFVARHTRIAYDPYHPDETRPNHFPLLLKWHGKGIGTARLDLRDGATAVIRLVAIARTEQGRGHGRVLNDKAEAFARSKGVARLLVNAAPEAVGFYERMGFAREAWDAGELTGIASGAVQMAKSIG